MRSLTFWERVKTFFVRSKFTLLALPRLLSRALASVENRAKPDAAPRFAPVALPAAGVKRYEEKRTRAHGGCLWLSEATKDVTSCEKRR